MFWLRQKCTQKTSVPDRKSPSNRDSHFGDFSFMPPGGDGKYDTGNPINDFDRASSLLSIIQEPDDSQLDSQSLNHSVFLYSETNKELKEKYQQIKTKRPRPKRRYRRPVLNKGLGDPYEAEGIVFAYY